MFCVVTGFSPGFGMATAADTLGSQAYGRDSKSPLVGIVLQQSVLILMLLAVPVGIVWWFAEPIFLLMRQDPEVAALGGLYCRVLILGLPAIYIFEALKKYTQVQGTASACRGRATSGEPSSHTDCFTHENGLGRGAGLTHVAMLALAVGAAVLALGSYLFIYAFGFGFVGAPIALVVCYWSLVAFTLAYIKLRGLHRNTWYGWSRAALHGWGIYLRLGLPGMLMLMYVAMEEARTG